MLRAELQSRVARRLFGLFLLAAMLPVAILGLFTYVQVRDHLLELSEKQLLQQSKGFGMNLIGRLQRHADELRRRAIRFAESTAVEGGNGFSAFRSVQPEALTLTREQQRHLQRGQVLLVSGAAGGYSLLTRLADGSGLIQGDLETRALWQDEDMLLPYCILDSSEQSLYCSPELDGPTLRLPAERLRHAGVFTWQTQTETYLAAYWHALLQASYAHPGFTVVTLHARSDALAALAHFRELFPAILALSLVAAA